MLNSKIIIFLVSTLVTININSAAAKSLPTYLTACKEDDPNLNACALESAKKGLPSLLKGDKKYNIPLLNPLSIDKAEIPGNNLDLIFTNVKIFGLDSAVLQETKIDTKKQHVEISFTAPRLWADTDYTMDGKILVLPIKGQGKGNITLVDIDVVYIADYVKEKKDDGMEYLKINDATIEYKMKRAYFQLENLFNGDKALSDATHKFLNENWEDVVKEMGPPIIETIKLIASQIISGIASTVPYKNLWAQ